MTPTCPKCGSSDLCQSATYPRYLVCGDCEAMIDQTKPEPAPSEPRWPEDFRPDWMNRPAPRCERHGELLDRCRHCRKAEADRARDEFIASKGEDRCAECGYHSRATLEETWDAAMEYMRKAGKK